MIMSDDLIKATLDKKFKYFLHILIFFLNALQMAFVIQVNFAHLHPLRLLFARPVLFCSMPYTERKLALLVFLNLLTKPSFILL